MSEEILLSQIRKKRVVDLNTANILLQLGWRQSGPLDGLLWCSSCGSPTTWKDDAGKPLHLWCAEFAD